jgi:lipoate-protein ligase A
MLKSLKIPVEKLKAKEIDSVKERVTCLNWELGATPPLEAIKDAVKEGFERHLNIKLVSSGLTDLEKRVFGEKLVSFRSETWINQVKPVYQKRETVQASYKSEAGMVRFSLSVNLPQNRIRDVYITGDFLSFPTRALYDLESQLRGVPLDKNQIQKIIGSFFDKGDIRIPGMTKEDFLNPLYSALDKISITQYGIALDYCNLISTTNGCFSDVIKAKPEVLLLPYCSKLSECDLRYEKGCRICGKCSIGPAWEFGRQKKMKVISILSFEDLLNELDKMKHNRVKAFIGCCCQPFFIKHFEDFETAGIPGVLLDIDNTTCYELDQAPKAYAGSFENQTHVNLDLLKTVIDII